MNCLRGSRQPQNSPFSFFMEVVGSSALKSHLAPNGKASVKHVEIDAKCNYQRLFLPISSENSIKKQDIFREKRLSCYSRKREEEERASGNIILTSRHYDAPRKRELWRAVKGRKMRRKNHRHHIFFLPPSQEHLFLEANADAAFYRSHLSSSPIARGQFRLYKERLMRNEATKRPLFFSKPQRSN